MPTPLERDAKESLCPIEEAEASRVRAILHSHPQSVRFSAEGNLLASYLLIVIPFNQILCSVSHMDLAEILVQGKLMYLLKGENLLDLKRARWEGTEALARGKHTFPENNFTLHDSQSVGTRPGCSALGPG